MIMLNYLIMIRNARMRSVGCINEDGAGRSYSISNSDLTVDSCSFFRTTIYNGEGGVIFISNYDLSLLDSTFVNCSASDDGGAIKVNNGNCVISRCCASSCAVYSADGALAYITVKASLIIEHLSFMECSKTIQSYHTLSLSYNDISLEYVNGSKTINGANPFGFVNNAQSLFMSYVTMIHNYAEGTIFTVFEYTSNDLSYINFVNNSEKTLTFGLICFDKIFFDPGPLMLEKSSNGRVLDIGGYLINNIVVLDTVGLLFYLNAEFNLQIHNGHFGNIGTAIANGVFETINCISGNPTLLSISHYYKNGCQIGDQQIPDKTFEETPMQTFKETPMKSFEETPMKSFEETPVKTFEETPMKSFEETPMKSFEETPMQTFEETPVKTFEETPMKSFEETPIKTFEETPMETLEETPMKTLEETPVNSFNNQNTSNSVLYSLSITIGTILTVSMIAFGVSYFLKGKMDEPFNSDDEKLDI